jgi:hypothetical protein
MPDENRLSLRTGENRMRPCPPGLRDETAQPAAQSSESQWGRALMPQRSGPHVKGTMSRPVYRQTARDMPSCNVLLIRNPLDVPQDSFGVGSERTCGGTSSKGRLRPGDLLPRGRRSKALQANGVGPRSRQRYRCLGHAAVGSFRLIEARVHSVQASGPRHEISSQDHLNASGPKTNKRVPVIATHFTRLYRRPREAV